METKRCIQCKEIKLIKDFGKYRNSTKTGYHIGYRKTCKKCQIVNTFDQRKEYCQRNFDKIREYGRKYDCLKRSGTPKHREKNRKYYARNRDEVLQRRKKFYNENREEILRQQKGDVEKYKARYIFRNALKAGFIYKQPCSICGNPKSHGHHSDYSKPLNITWLCCRHHLGKY